MTEPAPRLRMNADEFIAWAMERPDPERYELVAGEVVAMSPERALHGRTKVAVFDALRVAVSRASLACEAFIDGMAVRVDDGTVYEPDALLRCGPPLADDRVEVRDPVIVVEVISPSSKRRDTGGKLEDYFRLPPVRHYLILKTANRTLIHHERDGAGEMRTRILREGRLELDPPGIALEVKALFS